MYSRFAYLLFVLTLLGLKPSAAHADYCFENWACVEIIEHSNKVEFWIYNEKPYPFTSSIKVKGQNLGKKGRKQNQFHKTVVLDEFERKKVLELYVLDNSQPYSFDDSFFWTPGDMHAKHDGSTYHLPYSQDQHFRIVQGFDGGYSHMGPSRYAVDFAMPVGTPIHAAREGQVIDLTEHHNIGGASRRYAQYANFVTILHSDGTLGEYYHLQQHGVTVDIGDRVYAGQLIGYSGNTGFSSLPHLHFAVYRARSFGNYESLPFKFYPR